MRALLGFACVVVLGCTGSRAGEREVVGALHGYAERLKAMDTKGLAGTYTEDGEASSVGGPTLRGPAQIEAHLATFSAFHVLEASMEPDSTRVEGASAHQEGTYAQRVTLPGGETVQVHGRFVADWQKVGDQWRLRRLQTIPST